MSLESGLRAKLLESVAVAAIVGDRCYPHDAPPSAAGPFLTYQLIVDEKPRFLSGGVRYRKFVYEIGCFDTVYDDAETLANAVYTALGGNNALETTLDGTEVILKWDDEPTHKFRFQAADFPRDYVMLDLIIMVK